MGRGVSRYGIVDRNTPITTSVKETAGGLPAVISAWKHGVSKMGFVGSTVALGKANQKRGFDCPGCAWPDPKHRSPFEYCENGAKAISDEATIKTIPDSFWQEHSIHALGRKSDQWLNSQGRLSRPLILERDSNHYVPSDWDRAIGIIAKSLDALEDPNDAYFYTSGRASNEAAYLWQLLARQYGTNNLPDCSNMCHESSGVALNESIGIGKGTVRLEDFDKADLIVIVGQNPGTNHPRMLSALKSAKKSGASVLSINPLKETGMRRFRHPQSPIDMLGAGTQISDDHVNIKINGDMALFRAIGSIILDKGYHDPDFINLNTTGFLDYAKIAQKIDWDLIEHLTGQDRGRINEISDYFCRSRRTIVCWAMGITQHKNSVNTIREIMNVLLLKGDIGREGSGPCPVRGHSNVQGDRTVGITHAPDEFFIEKLSKEFEIDTPSDHGADSVNAVMKMKKSGGIFLSLGGNFLSAMSDTDYTAEALEKCSLTVQISTKLNRSHLITGDVGIILPCLGRTDQQVTSHGPQLLTVENSMGIVHVSRGHNIRSTMAIKPEPTIISSIGTKLQSLRGGTVPWKEFGSDFDKIRDSIERVVPGFEAYNTRVKSGEGFELPNPPRDSRRFDTKSGRAEFSSHEVDGFQPKHGTFVMMTIRSHDQFNTTIYTNNDRYRGISGSRNVVLMSAMDMDKMRLRTGEVVGLQTVHQGRRLVSEGWHVIPYDIPVGSIATYFPESNRLIPIESVADDSNTPTSKSVMVEVISSRLSSML